MNADKNYALFIGVYPRLSAGEKPLVGLTANLGRSSHAADKTEPGV
jgi:hypothetical protein